MQVENGKVENINNSSISGLVKIFAAEQDHFVLIFKHYFYCQQWQL
jgi:hypothetical protein